MRNTPLVSVIIPTYKSGHTLKNAIDSVLDQTYKDIEIIVVDDNNNNTEYREKTELVMKNYENENKVIYIKHDKNRNGAAARNTGFKHSKGEYVCFLDDDDVFLPSKVEKQAIFLEKNNKFQAVYCWRYQHGEVIKYEKVGDLSEELLTLTFTPYTSSIMIKKECYQDLGGFDESYRRHQDYEFLLRFFERFSIGVIREPLIEIIGNDVNNGLKGIELERLKDQFLNQFSHQIDIVDKKQKNFKKLVLSKHYSTVFFSYCRLFRIGSASRIFLKYSLICGLSFWKCNLSYLIKYLSVKRKNNDND